MTPTDWNAYRALEGSYVHFQPFFYSLENSQPFVRFGQADRWQVNPVRVHGATGGCNVFDWFRSLRSWLRIFRPAQILIGWVLATMGFFGLTGLIRKD